MANEFFLHCPRCVEESLPPNIEVSAGEYGVKVGCFNHQITLITIRDGDGIEELKAQAVNHKCDCCECDDTDPTDDKGCPHSEVVHDVLEAQGLVDVKGVDEEGNVVLDYMNWEEYSEKINPQDGFVLVVGDPEEDLVCHGPFDDDKGAWKFFNKHFKNVDGWLVPMYPIMEK